MRKKNISVYRDDSHGASENVEGEDYESRGADSMETIKAILDGGGARTSGGAHVRILKTLKSRQRYRLLKQQKLASQMGMLKTFANC